MELKGKLFKFSSPFSNLIWAYSHASLQRAELGVDYSSVRACVHASVPLLGEAQNLWFCTIPSEISENYLCETQEVAENLGNYSGMYFDLLVIT